MIYTYIKFTNTYKQHFLSFFNTVNINVIYQQYFKDIFHSHYERESLNNSEVEQFPGQAQPTPQLQINFNEVLQLNIRHQVQQQRLDDVETSEDKQIRINALNQELERIKNPSLLYCKEHKTLMSGFKVSTNNNSMLDPNNEERMF
ncbi:Hypothetical_protein [Hexamita inflata]|uniref:Hypothetical_protein n=1 Tax=Hexamita inflata TaxID=28002 RepID=A0AA86UCM8_9EUKA|nr:Hypothetical protein HINF_LOCUS34531 [Hexamita inflata]